MRATLATELVDEGYPEHVCEAWLGHTKKTADRHYRQVTELQFQKASQKVPTQMGCTENAVDITSLESNSSKKKRAAKSDAVHAGNELQINEATNKKAVNCSVLQSTASVCNASMTPTGFEPVLQA